MALLNCGSFQISKDKPYNSGQWTTARFNSFIKSALRSASQRWPPRFEALNKAKTGKKINVKTGRLAEHYRCNECNSTFPAKEVQVDHIKSIMKDAKSWDDVIKNMFCETDGLQILCLDCHKLKTNKEYSFLLHFEG